MDGRSESEALRSVDPLLKRVAGLYSVQGATRDDLFQEARVAFIMAYRRRPVRPMSSWTWRAAQWAILKYARDREYLVRPSSRVHEDLVTFDPQDEGSLYDPWPEVNDRMWAKKLIGRLPLRRRQAVALYCKGAGYVEIAHRMGVHATVARRYVLLGAAQLREIEERRT